LQRDHAIADIQQAICDFLLVVCSILDHFQDGTTRDLLSRQEITSHAFWFMCKHIIVNVLEEWESETFLAVEVTLKFTQGHQWSN